MPNDPWRGYNQGLDRLNRSLTELSALRLSKERLTQSAKKIDQDQQRIGLQKKQLDVGMMKFMMESGNYEEASNFYNRNMKDEGEADIVFEEKTGTIAWYKQDDKFIGINETTGQVEERDIPGAVGKDEQADIDVDREVDKAKRLRDIAVEDTQGDIRKKPINIDGVPSIQEMIHKDGKWQPHGDAYPRRKGETSTDDELPDINTAIDEAVSDIIEFGEGVDEFQFETLIVDLATMYPEYEADLIVGELTKRLEAKAVEQAGDGANNNIEDEKGDPTENEVAKRWVDSLSGVIPYEKPITKLPESELTHKEVKTDKKLRPEDLIRLKKKIEGLNKLRGKNNL